MPPKVLRRCSLCKNFHATFLVNDPILGKGYYCSRCFFAWQQKHPELRGEPIPPEQPDTPIPQEEPHRLRAGRKKGQP